jgi:hypothetical protein
MVPGDTAPVDLRARLNRRVAEGRPRDWRILVPLSSMGHGRRVVDPAGPRGEAFVDVDPADGALAFRDERVRQLVETLDDLLSNDPYVLRAFQLLRLARTMRREYEPARGRIIPLARAHVDQPVRFVLLPAGDVKARHSARPFAYLEPAPNGYLRAETGGASAILISGLPEPGREAQLRRSLAHELAHYINHLLQDGGLPYSGRERAHSLYDVRTAAFAYVEGEPQAFLEFLQHLVGEGHSAGPLIRRTLKRAAFVRRLVTPNQFLRSELACGRVLAALLNDRSIRGHYLRPSFYEVVASAYPGLAGAYRLTREQVRAAIPPEENAYIKVQWVRMRHDPADTLELLRAYLTEFPSQRRMALRVIADVSSGLLISEDAPRRALQEAAARIRDAANPLLGEAVRVRGENRRWWRRVVMRGTGLVGDPRAPLLARTRRGVVDLNRAEVEELAHVLRVSSTEAAKLARNRAALRPGEYLDLLDILRPPPRALRQGGNWAPLASSTWKRVLSAVESGRELSASPLRRRDH